jgi:hypothetical protein
MLAKAETGLQNSKKSEIKILAVTTREGLFKAHFLPKPSIYGQRSRDRRLTGKPGLPCSACFTQSAKELGLSSREQWEPLSRF